MTTSRLRPNPVDKHEVRRQALADSALRTLGELGYARSSLREIAGNSEFSHGVVHYYFADKLELILYGVRRYKATCVRRYDDVIARSTTGPELVDAFTAKLRETIVDEAPMHRLWYDLRAQSMFEPALVEAVGQIDGALRDMIWRVLMRYSELCDRAPRVDPATAYGALDGLFQQALLGHQHSTDDAPLDELEARVRVVLPLLLAP